MSSLRLITIKCQRPTCGIIGADTADVFDLAFGNGRGMRLWPAFHRSGGQLFDVFITVGLQHGLMIGLLVRNW